MNLAPALSCFLENVNETFLTSEPNFTAPKPVRRSNNNLATLERGNSLTVDIFFTIFIRDEIAPKS